MTDRERDLQTSRAEKPLGEQSLITIHKVLEAFDRERKGWQLIQKDLFDSRQAVVLSALEVLGRLREPGSLQMVARLFAHKDDEIRRAAIATAGELAHPDARRILLDLYNITQEQRLRSTIMESLWKVAGGDEQVRALVTECAGSALVPPAVRASAVALLLTVDRESAPDQLLAEAQGEYVDRVYAIADSNASVAPAVLRHGLAQYASLSQANRRVLVSMAAAHALPGAEQVFTRALKDVDPEVRLAAYRAVAHGGDGGSLDGTVRLLWEDAEEDPAIEAEAWSAIERIEDRLKEKSIRLSFVPKGGTAAEIRTLFEELAASEREASPQAPVSPGAKAREFLEFYGDEELKRTLVEFLKGNTASSKGDLVRKLRNSTTRLETCHLDGYRALIDIIGNPRRHVAGLLIRELAQARLGKRKLLHRLVRCLRLSRLCRAKSRDGDDACFTRIYEWSTSSGLYRLAEAALAALTALDAAKAMVIASRCLQPPASVKMLTIASIRMLKDLDWRSMEPVVDKLLEATEDPHVMLNLMEALGTLHLPLADETVKLLLNRFERNNDMEVASRIADVIASRADFAVFDSVRAIFDAGDQSKQHLCLSILGRMILRNVVTNKDRLVEFLYKVLRSGSGDLQARGACLLWRLGDEYSVKVIRDLIEKGAIDTTEQIVQGLSGCVGPAIIPVLLPLLRTEAAKVQHSLRATLLSTEAEEARQIILSRLLEGADAEPDAGGTAQQAEIKLDLLRERDSYQFDREHVQPLAVFFTDIQGYSTKVEHLSGMELAVFIQEYEGVLLPVVGSHRGELIKKMGDGHLFVFNSPLDATLAAVRLQKALTRFNSYREERLRINVRIGIHFGDVVRTEGDVLGNDVNIAARLQGAARAGAALVSEIVQNKIKDHVHSKGVGYINIKGISEPVNAFEPYEIAVDLPPELDPLRKSGTKSGPVPRPAEAPAKPAQPAANVRSAGVSADLRAYLRETFAALNEACRKAELGEIEVAQVRRQVRERWEGVKKRLAPTGDRQGPPAVETGPSPLPPSQSR